MITQGCTVAHTTKEIMVTDSMSDQTEWTWVKQFETSKEENTDVVIEWLNRWTMKTSVIGKRQEEKLFGVVNHTLNLKFHPVDPHFGGLVLSKEQLYPLWLI